MEAIWLITLINGIYYASILFLISLGLNIIFGVGEILNIAHGEFYAFGAYMATWLIMAFGTHVPPQIVFSFLLSGLILAAIIGLITEVIFIRPMYRRALEYQLLLTYGLLLAYEDIIRLIWGGEAYHASAPLKILGELNVMGYIYPIYFISIILESVIVGIIAWYILFKTKIGTMIRAVSMDREMASAIGINIKKISTIAFVFGTALAGLSGALVAPTMEITLGIGLEPLLLSFIIISIGGLGNIKGALIGSIIIGLMRSVGIVMFPEIELAITFLLAAIILAIKPEGFFGGGKR